jgi:AcrR family transcriptional regulator
MMIPGKTTGVRADRAAARARRAHGERTRQAILEAAVDIASEEGLEGLTIGRLAAELSMSKSGLFAHFGAKEELQLATVEAAREVFVREVIRPAFESPKGLARLWSLCDVWLGYVRREVFRGGCFFAAAAAEFDGRPGAVRDRVAAIMKEWLGLLGRSVAEAQTEGQLDPSADPAQLTFELNALEMGANWAYQLHGDRQAFARARAAMIERLRSLATPEGLPLLPPLKQSKARPARAARGKART